MSEHRGNYCINHITDDNAILNKLFFPPVNFNYQSKLSYLCYMLKILIIGIIGYFLYRFVVKFLIPLAKLVRMTHRSIREVKQKMNRSAGAARKEKVKHAPPPPIEGEYIDYEEVR